MKLIAYAWLSGRRDRSAVLSAMEEFARSRGHEVSMWVEDSSSDKRMLPETLAVLHRPDVNARGLIVYALGDLMLTGADGPDARHLEPFLRKLGPKLLSVSERMEDGIPDSFRELLDEGADKG